MPSHSNVAAHRSQAAAEVCSAAATTDSSAAVQHSADSNNFTVQVHIVTDDDIQAEKADDAAQAKMDAVRRSQQQNLNVCRSAYAPRPRLETAGVDASSGLPRMRRRAAVEASLQRQVVEIQQADAFTQILNEARAAVLFLSNSRAIAEAFSFLDIRENVGTTLVLTHTLVKNSQAAAQQKAGLRVTLPPALHWLRQDHAEYELIREADRAAPVLPCEVGPIDVAAVVAAFERAKLNFFLPEFRHDVIERYELHMPCSTETACAAFAALYAQPLPALSEATMMKLADAQLGGRCRRKLLVVERALRLPGKHLDRFRFSADNKAGLFAAAWSLGLCLLPGDKRQPLLPLFVEDFARLPNQADLLGVSTLGYLNLEMGGSAHTHLPRLRRLVGVGELETDMCNKSTLWAA